MIDQLTLPEKLFIIMQSKRYSNIRLKMKNIQRFYVVGACFLELERRKKISIGDNLSVQVIDTEPAHIHYLDEMLQQIAKEKREKSLTSWLRGFMVKTWNANKVYDLLIQDLFEKELMRVKRKLWIKQYVALESIEQQIVNEIRSEILGDGTIRYDVLVLAMILHSVNSLKKWFSKEERKRWKERLKEWKTAHPEEWKKVKLIIRVGSSGAAVGVVGAAT